MNILKTFIAVMMLCPSAFGENIEWDARICFMGCMENPGKYDIGAYVDKEKFCMCSCENMPDYFTLQDMRAVINPKANSKDFPKEKMLNLAIYCSQRSLLSKHTKGSPIKKHGLHSVFLEKEPLRRPTPKIPLEECETLARLIAANIKKKQKTEEYINNYCPAELITDILEKQAKKEEEEKRHSEEIAKVWDRFFEETPKKQVQKPQKKNDDLDRAVVFADIERAGAESVKPSVLGSFYRGLHDAGLEAKTLDESAVILGGQTLMAVGGVFGEDNKLVKWGKKIVQSGARDMDEERAEIERRSFSSFRPELKERFSYKFGVFSFYVFIILFCTASIYAFIADAKTKKK